MTPALLSPLRLRELELPNRIVVSPMCQYSAVDGCATNWHLVHLGQYAVSGAGLVILEATHVERRGRITHGCLGLYSDENEAALVRVVDFFRRHGHARLGIQISHSGRKGSARRPWEGRGEALTAGEDAWGTVSASDLPFDEGWPQPAVLDADGMAAVREATPTCSHRWTWASPRLRNRVLMGSMHTGLEDRARISPLAAYFAERAAGGVGLIVTGGFSPNTWAG
jgi:2,4-dienoyl-CoA reductase-like NADH-dependent reductase (Old Yellow Enzyme family)